MTDAAVPRRSRALVVTGVVLMIVSVIVTFVGIAGVVDSSINAVDAPRIDVPGERSLPFETGGYAVYAPKPASGQAGIDDVRTADITVTGAGGAAIPVVAIDSNLVVSDGQIQWAAVGQFVIDEPGDYVVRIGPPAETTVLVARHDRRGRRAQRAVGAAVGPRVRRLHRRRGPDVHRGGPPRRRRRPRPRRPLRSRSPPGPTRPARPEDN